MQNMFRLSKYAFLIELSHDPIVDEILGFELGEFAIDALEDAQRVAHAVDRRKDASAVQRAHRLVTRDGVLGALQAQPLG